jgi:hypothetical protein
MSEKSRLIRSIITILAFFAVLSGGVLIGQVHGYRRHMSVAMESLRSAQHSVHEAIRDGGGRHSRMALEHIEIAIREVQEDLR